MTTFWYVLRTIVLLYGLACVVSVILIVAAWIWMYRRRVDDRNGGDAPRVAWESVGYRIRSRRHSQVTPVAYWDVSALRALREISTHEDAT